MTFVTDAPLAEFDGLSSRDEDGAAFGFVGGFTMDFLRIFRIATISSRRASKTPEILLASLD
ncbi:MAG: hypothetical protein IPL32_14510 [Chloracidobacterium sp.]|nr:hypothetical protein [Chloracidobacterium sp.]